MDVAAACECFEGGHAPVLIGHSYGGTIVVGAMERHSDLFGGAIVCDTIAMPDGKMKALAKQMNDLGSQDPKQQNKIYETYEGARDRFRLVPQQSARSEAALAYIAHHSIRKIGDEWSWKFSPRVFLTCGDREGRLLSLPRRIANCPNLRGIVYGDESILCNGNSKRHLRGLGCRAPIIGIPRARHHLMVDQPMALVTALRSLLER